MSFRHGNRGQKDDLQDVKKIRIGDDPADSVAAGDSGSGGGGDGTKKTSISFNLGAGPDTSPLSQLNLSSCVPVTTQLIPLIHSDMLKLSWKGD